MSRVLSWRLTRSDSFSAKIWMPGLPFRDHWVASERETESQLYCNHRPQIPYNRINSYNFDFSRDRKHRPELAYTSGKC